MSDDTPEQPRPAPRQSMIGALIFALQPIMMNVISLPATAYIVQRLGSTAFGQWSAANSLVITMSAVFSLGLRGQYVREIARDPDRIPEATAQQFGLRSLLSVGAALSSLGVAVSLGYPPIVLGCTMIAGIGCLLQSLSATGIDLYQATRRLPTVAGVMMVQGLSLTAASIVAAWSGWGPIGLALAYMLGPLISFGLYFEMIRRHDFPIRVDWGLAGFLRFIKASRFLVVQQLVATVGRNAEGLAGPKLLGMSRYGLLAIGTMLPERMAVLPDGLATALFPVVASLFAVDRAAAAREVSRYVKLTLGLCLPLCILTTAIAPPLALILLPAEANLCTAVIRATIWGVPLMGLDMIMLYALNAAGQERAQIKVLIVGNVTSMIVTVVLIARFGLAGACAGYLARQVIAIAQRLPLFLRMFAIGWSDLAIPRLIAAGLVMGVALWLIHSPLWTLLPSTPDRGSAVYWVRLLGLLGVEAGIGLAIYMTAALFLRVFGGAEWEAILQRLSRRLPPALSTRLARIASTPQNQGGVRTDHSDNPIP